MKIVIALGGNALGYTPKEQLDNAKLTAKYIKDIIKEGHDVIITHGNGPQVGLINLAFEEAKNNNSKIPAMPFAECSAMSEGYIAYHLEESLQNELNSEGLNKKVISLVTRIEVDKNDAAFKNPTKPIGNFYTLDEIKDLGFPYKEDSGRGYRRVIASPKPQSILELDAIEKLSNSGFVVICCGGGGIPVVKDNSKYVGIDAVIDKDFASAKLASNIKADALLILTAVKAAKINFLKENDLKRHLENKEFREGSMKPKIEAALNFLSENKKGIAIITNIENAKDALSLKAGTIVEN